MPLLRQYAIAVLAEERTCSRSPELRSRGSRHPTRPCRCVGPASTSSSRLSWKSFGPAWPCQRHSHIFHDAIGTR